MADYLRAVWLKVNFVKGYKCLIQAKQLVSENDDRKVLRKLHDGSRRRLRTKKSSRGSVTC